MHSNDFEYDPQVYSIKLLRAYSSCINTKAYRMLVLINMLLFIIRETWLLFFYGLHFYFHFSLELCEKQMFQY